MTASGPASGPVALDVLAAARSIQAARSAQNTRCPAARLIASMTPEHAAGLAQLLLMDRYDMPTAVIVETMALYGYTFAEKPLQRHRRAQTGGSGCTCPSPTTPNG